MFNNWINKAFFMLFCLLCTRSMLAMDDACEGDTDSIKIVPTGTSVVRSACVEVTDSDKRDIIVKAVPLTQACAQLHGFDWQEKRAVVFPDDKPDFCSVIAVPCAHEGFFSYAEEVWDKDECVYLCSFPASVVQKPLEEKKRKLNISAIKTVERGSLNFESRENIILYALKCFSGDSFSDSIDSSCNTGFLYRIILLASSRILFEQLKSTSVLRWNVHNAVYGKGTSNMQLVEETKLRTFVLDMCETERFRVFEAFLFQDKGKDWLEPLKIAFYMKNGHCCEEESINEDQDLVDGEEESIGKQQASWHKLFKTCNDFEDFDAYHKKEVVSLQKAFDVDTQNLEEKQAREMQKFLQAQHYDTLALEKYQKHAMQRLLERQASEKKCLIKVQKKGKRL